MYGNINMPTYEIWLFIASVGSEGLDEPALSRSLTHMGQYQLLSVLSARLSPLNIDHSRN